VIDLADDATVVLPIADRDQAPESPPSGWCGETAIQEGLLHLGMWAPQKKIHDAGKASHPDLYSQDIPVALSALGVAYTVYAPAKPGYGPYSEWVRGVLDQGDSVIAGVKILPTEHPEWGLDHFVLAVGYGPKGLLVNTTWGKRAWVADTTTKGLSLAHAFYAIRLRAVAHPKDAQPARLEVLEENPFEVKLRVRCEGLASGEQVRLEERSGAFDEKVAATELLTAVSGRAESVWTIAAKSVFRFHCVKPES
jgi:hypothetical protein